MLRWMPIVEAVRLFKSTCSFTCDVPHLANEMAVLFVKAKRNSTCVVKMKYYDKTRF